MKPYTQLNSNTLENTIVEYFFISHLGASELVEPSAWLRKYYCFCFCRLCSLKMKPLMVQIEQCTITKWCSIRTLKKSQKNFNHIDAIKFIKTLYLIRLNSLLLFLTTSSLDKILVSLLISHKAFSSSHFDLNPKSF